MRDYPNFDIDFCGSLIYTLTLKAASDFVPLDPVFLYSVARTSDSGFAKTMRKRRIALISFSERTDPEDLSEALQHSGCEIEAEDRLPHTADLAVAFFGAEGCTEDAIETVRLMARAGPLLCVFHVSCADRCPEVLANCMDFLQWPCTTAELVRRLELCGAGGGTETETGAEAAAIVSEFVDLSLIGESPLFVTFLQKLKKASQYAAPVLLEGETGTGKELAARAIHYLGARRNHPFIPVNCGAIPDDLFENEFFGHEKGAFTDARAPQEGLVSLADGGTLFLDEVETLSSKAQVKLLRFLQNYDFKPLGGQRVRRADIRTIAASNTPLDELVAQKSFRSDLLYRLRVVQLECPPLRRRAGDIELLARHFLRYFANLYSGSVRHLSQWTLAWMARYPWPGNVRELENLIHRCYIASDEPVIHLDGDGATRSETAPALSKELSFHRAKAEAIREFEISYLTRLISDCRGNVTLAAKKAGKERRALGKLLKKHRIAAAG